ncbi:DNA (cytosine-5)-methyltransferase 1 [freshwater sediment metagenome]|uniref:DNA (cytosine-5-)-methyltransferase n=1 Tax=freshwater sediment metagenome TaxID=556182 RepID=A0AA48RCS6_9ZZZZ
MRPVKESGELKFRLVDLFAGIGGLRRGFAAIGGECVYTCEWDKYAQKTYAKNYPEDEHEIIADIRDVVPSAVPDHEVLLAGFPCQPFSIAGVSKKNALGRSHGFACEAQGTLFFNLARIIEAKRPPVFLLENVKNLVNHDRGQTFRIVRRVLEEDLGYHISCKVIDAKSWVPQHRERIFIAGFRDKPCDFTFDDMHIPDPMKGPKLRKILHSSSERAERPYTAAKGAVMPKYTLTEHLWSYLQAYADKHREAGNGFGYSLFGPDGVARTLSARYYKDGSEILIETQGAGPPRRLTPRECARLMGYPDNFYIPVSDTQAYKQFGNSVVVPVVEAVARHMEPHILKALRGAAAKKAAIA